MTQVRSNTETIWRNSFRVCVLADSERHLGHIVRENGGWLAFDATHTSGDGADFRPLGFFGSIASAKEAVRSATAQPRV